MSNHGKYVDQPKVLKEDIFLGEEEADEETLYQPSWHVEHCCWVQKCVPEQRYLGASKSDGKVGHGSRLRHKRLSGVAKWSR